MHVRACVHVYTVVYVRVCVRNVLMCVFVCVCAYVCACGYVCVHAHAYRLKRPSSWCVSSPREGQPPKLFVPLRLGRLSRPVPLRLGRLSRPVPFTLKICKVTPMRASRGPCNLII
jgi:hypothetical protein